MSEPDTAAERSRELSEIAARYARNGDVGCPEMVAEFAAALRDAEAGAIERVARYHDARYVELRDNGPRGPEGQTTVIVGAHMAAHYESAAHFRAFAPTAVSPWREIETAARAVIAWQESAHKQRIVTPADLEAAIDTLKAALPSPPAPEDRK